MSGITKSLQSLQSGGGDDDSDNEEEEEGEGDGYHGSDDGHNDDSADDGGGGDYNNESQHLLNTSNLQYTLFYPIYNFILHKPSEEGSSVTPN